MERNLSLSTLCGEGNHRFCAWSRCSCDCHRPEELVSDFTVRLYRRGEDRARVEVIGNRSGKTASLTCGVGLMWVYALLRALGQAGAYGEDNPFARSTR